MPATLTKEMAVERAAERIEEVLTELEKEIGQRVFSIEIDSRAAVRIYLFDAPRS